jgi:hypothetical protein
MVALGCVPTGGQADDVESPNRTIALMLQQAKDIDSHEERDHPGFL